MAEGAVGGRTRSRCIIRLFRNRRGGSCNWCFSSLLSAPTRRTDHKGLSPAGCCKHPMGHRTSHGGLFSGEYVALLEEISAFPPPPSALGGWQLRNDPGGSNRESWGWSPGSAEPARGYGLCLCPTLSLQAVLPSLQNRHHGPGSIHIFPAGMAGRRPPKPHRFLPGRSVAPAGTDGGWFSSSPNSREEGWDGCCLIQHREPETQTALGMLPSLPRMLAHSIHPSWKPFCRWDQLILLPAGLHSCLLRARRPGDAVSLLLLQSEEPGWRM